MVPFGPADGQGLRRSVHGYRRHSRACISDAPEVIVKEQESQVVSRHGVSCNAYPAVGPWVPNTHPGSSRDEPVLVNEAAKDVCPS